MHGFLLHNTSNWMDQIGSSYIENHKKINPFIDLGISYNNCLINNKYSLLFYKPADERALTLLSFAESDNYHIIFYGELYDINDRTAAVYVKEMLNKGEAVTNLNGNYSLIIIDKSNNIINLSCDFIGRRKLYYIYRDGVLAISNYDHMLVPFLEKPLTLDLVSILSSLYFDSSIRGYSFLKGIRTTNPDFETSFQDNKIENQKIEYALNSESNVEDIENDFSRYIDNRIMGSEKVNIDLTAGLDSRTVLALMLQKGKNSITAWTLGKTGMDFKIAKRIAKHVNIDHKLSSETLANKAEFRKHANFLAYCSNGSTNTLRAVNKIEINLNRTVPKIIGIYGTIAVGKNISGNVDYSSYKKGILKNKKNIIPQSKDLSDKLLNRCSDFIDELKDRYPELYQEMYYIRQRCGVWGSVIFNSTWDMQYITPFEDIKSIQRGLGLPSEVRKKSLSQHRILKKYSKYLYWLPINQNIFNNYYTSFINEKLRLKLRKFTGRVVSKLYFLSSSNISNITQQRNELFKKYFENSIQPQLMREDSISRKIFSDSELEIIINQLLNKNDGYICGQLYALELWKDMIEQMKDCEQFVNKD